MRAFCEWMSSQDVFKDAQARVFRALPDETSAAPVPPRGGAAAPGVQNSIAASAARGM